jgi:hypothetical protein
MILGIDVDGVLRDFITSLYKVFLSEYPQYDNGTLKPENHTEYDLAKIFPIGNKIHIFYQKKFAKDIFYDMARPYEGVIEVMNNLYKAGNIINILTANTVENGYVAEWLEYYEIPYNTIYHFKELKDKASVECDVYIDDNVEVVRNLLRVCPPTKLIFLQERPWNNVIIEKDIKRIKDLKEFQNYLFSRKEN